MEKEHRFILGLLKTNKYIKKLPDFEKTIKKLGIRFKKHPKSEKFSDEKGSEWASFPANKIIQVPINNKSILPSDARRQFGFYAHEEGHIKNGHSRERHPCHHRFEDCLSEELEAGMNFLKNLKKIREKFKEDFWLTWLEEIRDECKSCLKIVKVKECPQGEIKKIKKYLNAIDRASKIESRKIIFPKQGEKNA